MSVSQSSPSTATAGRCSVPTDDAGGSKALGDQGYSAIEILRYYYGDDMYINTAEAISGIPSSWPGYTLEIGSSGSKVRQMQEQLNVIAGAYPALPRVDADGIYGLRPPLPWKGFNLYSACPRPEPWITGPGTKISEV